jgi:hypothetical protein
MGGLWNLINPLAGMAGAVLGVEETQVRRHSAADQRSLAFGDLGFEPGGPAMGGGLADEAAPAAYASGRSSPIALGEIPFDGMY